MKSRQRAAALLEVLGVYVAGQLVTGQLIRLLNILPTNPLNTLTVGVTDAELTSATWQLFVLLMCKRSTNPVLKGPCRSGKLRV